MKTLILVCMLSVLVGCCGYNYETPANGKNGQNCTVHKSGIVSTVTCGSQVVTVTDGSNGAVGPKGDTGSSGSKGDTGDKGDKGDTGSQGPAGQDGINGSNGHSAAISVGTADVSLCSNGGDVINLGIDSNDDTSLEISEITQTAVVCNGLNGTNGIDGQDGSKGDKGDKGDTGSQGPAGSPSPFSATSLIAPCGVASSPWKEELLCLNNGTVLSSFSDNASGLNTRFSIIPTGTYIDTDNSNCSFSVVVAVSGSTTVSWNSGSNVYSSWSSNSVTCIAH